MLVPFFHRVPTFKGMSTKPQRKQSSSASDLAEEMQRLRNELEQQTRIFQSMLSSIAHFVYVFDRNGTFQYANKALLDLWGLRLQDAVGKNFCNLKYPEPWAA